MPEYYIGLISGTSLDAVDAALVDLESQPPRLLQAISHPLPETLRSELLKLCQPGENEIQRLGQADVWLGETLAEAVLALLSAAQIQSAEITAIGSHGQTVRHLPQGEHGFSLQIGDPNRIAEQTGITTVADFRRRDLAAGGEGAPLAPAFHAAVFAHTKTPRIILNLGGIANISLLDAERAQTVSGFDTGPANGLMDAWIQHHQQQPFDQDGAWAASGKVDEALLKQLLSDAYLQQQPPKSSGREYYNLAWLEKQLEAFPRQLAVEDVQATLCEFSAASVADAISRFVKPAQAALWELYVCGGGAHNNHLMSRLSACLAPMTVKTTSELGIDPDWVEACAFAWLARETLQQRPGNIPAVTGAQRSVVLGGIYPGHSPV